VSRTGVVAHVYNHEPFDPIQSPSLQNHHLVAEPTSSARRWVRRLAIAVVAIVAIGAALVAYDHRKSKGHPSAFVPADTSLQHPWFYFYPARGENARAFMVFFGNDVAFWEPHQDLAWRFAGEGISVVGIDLRKYLATLPADEPQRDSAVGASMPRIIERSRRELSADGLPVILAGHSFGAEVALWLADHDPPPGLTGILALNTRSTGHLFITPTDWLNKEASGAWSFSTIDAVRHIDPRVRIAIVRGAHDPFRGHDSAFAVAGGNRLRRFEIPMAGHALSTLLVAGPIISRAVRFLTDSAGR
jgi:type IV secretory pathway VirJ component